MGIKLVHRTIGFYTYAILGDPLASKDTRHAPVARLGDDLGHRC